MNLILLLDINLAAALVIVIILTVIIVTAAHITKCKKINRMMAIDRKIDEQIDELVDNILMDGWK